VDILPCSDRAFGGAGGRRQEKKKMKVRDARTAIEELESEKVLQSDVVTKEAVRAAEQVWTIDGILNHCTMYY
jgi:ATP-dependent protease HslVU (ClpYQ) ATPase subunit